jgi:Ca2+-dependent lipid-binding protein
VNVYGIDEGAQLSISVKEARDLKPMDYTGKSDPYVVLKFGGTQTHQTNFIRQDLNPVWNEVFTFDVETGRESMEVTVYDKDDFGSDDFEGRFVLTLDNYRDQLSHDEWFELEPEIP